MTNVSKDTWYDYFIEILHKKYPKKTHLAQALMDLLCIEREAVYRRLRKDVVFPVHEIGKIATAWNISLDELIGVNMGQVSFQMRKINYCEPSEDDANFLRFVIQSMNYLKQFPETEFMDICNKLPRQILAGYEHLYTFYLFKWIYEYGMESETDVVPFSNISHTEEKAQIIAEYNQIIKEIPNSSFIWDQRLFDNIVNDVRYFNSIYLVTDEEKNLIKKDLYDLLDYMLIVANKGAYPETQCKVNLYISQLNIDTNYSYTFTPEANICFVHVFEKYDIYTFNAEMTVNFKKWMQLKKRTSIQISEVDARSRVEFFTKQRQIVDTL